MLSKVNLFYSLPPIRNDKYINYHIYIFIYTINGCKTCW